MSGEVCSARLETLRGFAEAGIDGRVDAGLTGRIHRVGQLWDEVEAASEFRGVEGNPGPDLDATMDQFRANELWVRSIADALDDAPAVDGIATMEADEVAVVLASGSSAPDVDAIGFEPLEIVGSPVTSGFVNDPVNAATGNFVHADRDVRFAGLGSVLDVIRVYNSLAVGEPGSFGRGWTGPIDVGLDVSDAERGVVRARLGDGAVVPFVATAADGGSVRAWGRNRRRNLVLTETDGGWELSRDGGRRRWSFDADGLMVGGREAGAGWTVSRAPGEVTVAEVHSGRWVRYEMVDGLVAGVEASDGRSARYHYDPAGNCVAAERTVGDLVYELDDQGFLVASRDADGVTAFANTYDAAGRVVAQVAPHGRRTVFEYLATGGTRVLDDDEDGPSNLLYHDRWGNLTALYGSDGTALRATYDGEGRLVRVVNRGGGVTTYDHDDDGNIVRRTDPDGLAEERRYDELGREVWRRDRSGAEHRSHYGGEIRAPEVIEAPEGVTITVSYDDRWLPVTVTDGDGVVTTFEWNRDGLLTGFVNGAGDRTSFDYDPAGHLTAVTDPTGKAAAFELDEAGRVVVSTGVDGVAQVFEHTPGGRVRSMRTVGPGSWAATYGPHGDVVTVSDAMGATVALGYDPAGRLTTITGPDGSTTRQEWDGLGQLVAVTDPAGRVARQDHDRNGNSIAVTGLDGRTWQREVDPLDRTIAITGPDGARWTRTYHPDGQPATLTDPDGRTTRYEIDGLGRVTAEIGPDGGRRTWEWSPASRLVAVTTPAGRTYRYGHDRAGRPVSITDPDGVTTAVTLGPDGRPTEITTTPSVASPSATTGEPGLGADGGSTTIGFAYDDAGRVTGWHDTATGAHHHVEHDEWGLSVTRGDDAPVRFDRDARGLLSQVTDPAGMVTAFHRDLRGRLTGTTTGDHTTGIAYDQAGGFTAALDGAGVTTTVDGVVSPDGAAHDRALIGDGGLGYRLDRDRAGRIVGLAGLDGTVLATFAHDPAGRVVSAATDGVTTTIDWDDRGAPITVEHRTPEAAVHDRSPVTPGGPVRYRRDADGLVTARLEVGGAELSYERTPAGRLRRFVDSEAGVVELPPITAGAAVTTDRAGRVTGDEHGRRYGYDLAGRLASATTASGATTTYEYDDYGRLATETGPDGRRRFRYHASGQLRAVEADDGSTTRFAYDDAGRRTRTDHADGRITTYAWDPLGQLRAVTTTDPDRATTTRHLTRNALGQVLAIDDTPIGWDDAITGKVVRIGPDRYLRAGRWTRPATPGGTWTDGTTDDPWGREPDAGADQGAIRLGYRGELCVDGLVLMGDRVYDPDTRQFLSKDPLPPVPGTNGSMASPYTYAWCDPVNHIDPSGRQPVSIEEFDAWVDRNDTSRFTRAGQAMLDDPWGTLAMAGVVVVGTGLIVTGVGAPIGAGILIGAASTAAFGIATDDFNPREVALGGAFGAVPGGHTVRGAFLAAGAENLTGQVLIDGRGLDEISYTDALIQGTIGGAIPGVAGLGRFLPRGSADDVQPALLYRGDARPPADLHTNGMTARDPAMTQYDHLSGGNGLVSTSLDPSVADGFAIRHRGSVYVIEDPGTGYRVDYRGADRLFRHLRSEAEVNFPRIEPANIVGSFSPRSGPSGGRDWLPNPDYVPIVDDQSAEAAATRFVGIRPGSS